jgi:hypothetical protein
MVICEPGSTGARALPKQNRVTPFGELIRTDCRGTLMGNRGCLHDDEQRVRRSFASKRWIVCLLEFNGRHRTVMAPGRYTELFFLDEATALAAGHRPCAECQRARYLLFRACWTEGNRERSGGRIPSADDIDDVLHAERLDGTRGKRTYAERLSRLPSGVIVADEENRPHLVQERTLAPWTPGGYGPAVPMPTDRRFQVLTPRSTVRAIARGFPVGVHPTIRAA